MRAYLSLNGGADGSMQLRQLVLQLQLVGLCMARAAVEEPGRPVPGLLPAPRGVQPAGLQHTGHLMKQLLLQALHALLHLYNTIQVSWHDASQNPLFMNVQCINLGVEEKLSSRDILMTGISNAVTCKQASVSRLMHQYSQMDLSVLHNSSKLVAVSHVCSPDSAEGCTDQSKQ